MGAVIDAYSIPIHKSALQLERASNHTIGALDLALHGGDDYELLFTAPRNQTVPGRIAGVPVTRIGEIVRGKSVSIRLDGKKTSLKSGGWEHFRA